MGRTPRERIAELEKDPKKKEALARARIKVKQWIEDWKRSRLDEELEEWLLEYEQSVKEKEDV